MWAICFIMLLWLGKDGGKIGLDGCKLILFVWELTEFFMKTSLYGNKFLDHVLYVFFCIYVCIIHNISKYSYS